MRKIAFYYMVLGCCTVSLIACSNENNESDRDKPLPTNVSDSRRNTTGSQNTITGDTNKVASDSDQHGGGYKAP